MMNKNQLTELVIIPALHEIPHGYSVEAVLATKMVIAHESARGEYLKQINGPALGLIGMEPTTHDEVWRWGDSIVKNALAIGIIIKEDEKCLQFPPAERLLFDLRYNVFMLRQKLFMAPGALPSDEFEMAKYLKKHWNGGGKATATKYLNDFKRWD